MTAKHTPGPWLFQASPAHGYRIRTTDSSISLKFGSGDIGVVFFAGNGRSPEQCKADARLIAAAPELLAELHRQLEWEYNPCCDPDNQSDRYKRIQAVIAKATGSAA